MSHLSSAKIRLLAICLSVAALVLLATASFARAADTVYWGEFGSGKIGFANLAGGGGGNLDVTGASADLVNGLAIDSAAGKIYWVNAAPPKVLFANLSGGGGGELNTAGATMGPSSFLLGLAIDPAGGRVYWANANGEDKISYANLNGTGGGDINTAGATVDEPFGIAIDPAAGRVYWSNESGAISYANLNGTGGADLNTAGATTEEPSGVAIDAAAGRIYWGNYDGQSISYANLNGTGGGNLNTAGATTEEPFGIAIDPPAGRIYWANEEPGKISFASLSGSGGADLDTTPLTPDFPAFPVLLKAPAPGTMPQVGGASKPGSTLTCAPATWASDLLESFLYRVPQSTSTQWLKDGQPIAGATTTSLKASKVGSYACQGTATNHAGSTLQTSAPVAVFKLGKAKANAKKGTATLSVQVPGAGTVTLSGKKVAKQSRKRSPASPGTVKVTIKAKGKAKKTLAKKGKAKVKATVGFAPLGGSAANQTVKVTLKKKLSG